MFVIRKDKICEKYHIHNKKDKYNMNQESLCNKTNSSDDYLKINNQKRYDKEILHKYIVSMKDMFCEKCFEEFSKNIEI